MPKDDRAKLVALIVNSPDPDNSRHPSPGQSSYVDHNLFDILGENDEDDNGNSSAPSLNMNSLSINKMMSSHGAERADPQDRPDTTRALSIMNAVSSLIDSDTLQKSISDLHLGNIIHTLSTSQLVFPLPLCRILTRMSNGNTGRAIKLIIQSPLNPERNRPER